jgi:tetrapyrrole methylase family protein / MazG family protein
VGKPYAIRFALYGLILEFIMAADFSLSTIFQKLGCDDLTSVVLVQASTLEKSHIPPFPPEIPAVIIDIATKECAAEVKALLLSVYPNDHLVKVIHGFGAEKQILEETLLINFDKKFISDPSTSLLVPPLQKGYSFEQFREIIAHLRAPDGCPWDREQTHLTLRRHLLEESYESIDAIDSGDPAKMQEEFGDLLLQIVLNAQIAQEFNEFTMEDVIKGIHDKIVRRHPHVFGDVEVDGVRNVLQNWEKIKAAERDAHGESETSLLDGLPGALPAMIQAQEFQNRAARVGFDWPEIEGVLEKINEEIEEVRKAKDGDELTAELGDLFFALVNLARWKSIDAESALRATNRKFRNRFSYIERSVKKNKKRLEDMSLDEMESLWQEAKFQES